MNKHLEPLSAEQQQSYQQLLELHNTNRSLSNFLSLQKQMVMSPSRRSSPPRLAAHPMNMHLGSLAHTQMQLQSQMHQKLAAGLPPNHLNNFFKSPSSSSPSSSNITNTSSTSSMVSALANASSPLNHLQNMQPFDFRRLGAAAAGFGAFPPGHQHPRLSPELERHHLQQQIAAAQARRRMSESGASNEKQNIGSNLPNQTAGLMNMAMAGHHLPFHLPPQPNNISPAFNPLAASLMASSFSNLMNNSNSSKNKSPVEPKKEPNNRNRDESSIQNALNLSRDGRDSRSRSPKTMHSHMPRLPSTPTMQSPPSSMRKSHSPAKRQWGSVPLNLGVSITFLVFYIKH